MSQDGHVLMLLEQLETQLQKQGLWSTEPPSAAALASTLPFAVDQLRFEQWLQFVFLVKMRSLLAAGQPLPAAELSPMAEMSWPQGQARDALLPILQAMDQQLATA